MKYRNYRDDDECIAATAMSIVVCVALAAVLLLTGCVGRAGTIQAEGDALTETGTVKVATSGPVAQIEAKVEDVKADVEAALVKTEKSIESTVNASRDYIDRRGIGWRELAASFGMYALYSLAKDALFARAQRKRNR